MLPLKLLFLNVFIICSAFARQIPLGQLNSLQGPDLADDNGVDDTTPVIIRKAGYPVETHDVTTEDGYILEMHRIPRGRNSLSEQQLQGNGTRPVIFLQHGLLCSSADWVLSMPSKALGFILADAGYDVWIGNFRGNTYSRNHIHLDPNGFDFWQFSWDEMAEFDLPAMLTYVLNYTEEDRIFYAGHSMGTTTFMAMATKRPDIQDHILLANLLAPVAYVGHMKSPIRYIAPFEETVKQLIYSAKWGLFLPSNNVTTDVVDLACKGQNVARAICSTVIFAGCGFDLAQLNLTLVDTIGHHTPAGTSTFTVLQYGQEVNSNGFHAFDYGKKGNQAKYGTSTPPQYDIGAITAPVAVYWGDNDWLAQRDDVLRMTAQLPNLVHSYEVPYPTFNHMDFLYGIDADTLLYPEILKQMEIKWLEATR